MRHIIKNIFCCLLVVSFASCNSFLDVSPKEITGDTFYKTDGEIKSALLGVYAPLNFDSFYGNAYPLYLSGGDDLSFFQRDSPGNPPTSILLANANTSTAEIATFWKSLYEGINRANLLLESLDKPEAATNISASVAKNARAEAKFMRAFYYFNLVQAWGDVPLVLKSFKKLDNSIFQKRTKKDVVYNTLIQDIEDIIADLPEITSMRGTGTISQTAAMGVLARIYLFRAGEHKRDNMPEPEAVKDYYKAAHDWALKVKNSGVHALAPNYSQIFIDLAADKYNSQGVIESMWEAEFAGNREGAIQAAGRTGNTLGFGSKNDYSQNESLKESIGMVNPGYSYRFIYGTLKLYNLYEEQKDVERGDWNIAPFEYTYEADAKNNLTGVVVGRTYYFGKKPKNLDSVEGMPCVELAKNDFKGYPDAKGKTRSAAKYRREYEVVSPKSKNFTPINFPILRYSDVLLMLAEAENYLNGPTALAYECVNMVRQRAKIKVVNAGLSKSDFLEVIKDERAMELSFEALRRWDLVRWGDFLMAMKASIADVNNPDWNANHKYADTYFKVTDAYNYFPIPDLEMGANPMLQNPGW